VVSWVIGLLPLFFTLSVFVLPHFEFPDYKFFSSVQTFCTFKIVVCQFQVLVLCGLPLAVPSGWSNEDLPNSFPGRQEFYPAQPGGSIVPKATLSSNPTMVENSPHLAATSGRSTLDHIGVVNVLAQMCDFRHSSIVPLLSGHNA
jgi:hypothetical protein